MSFRVPDSSSPSTPGRGRDTGGSIFGFSHASTTPAGPPPSSAPSYTPAGEPSFLQSSIAGMGSKIKAPNFGRPNLRSRPGSHAPLASSIRSTAGAKPSQPSGLGKHSYSILDDLSDSDESGEDDAPPPNAPGTYGIPSDEEEDETEELDGADAHAQNHDGEMDEAEAEAEEDEMDGPDQDDAEPMEAEIDHEYDVEEDLLRELENADSPDGNLGGEHMDFLMATPAATEQMTKEAEDIFCASSARSAFGPRRDLKYAELARDLYSQLGCADISENDQVILETEEIVNHLYDEGVGPEDDEERLDDTLAAATFKLIEHIWEPYLGSLPRIDEEHAAKVGPAGDAPPFEKALWVAALVFRIHHTPPVRDQFGGYRTLPLPDILFKWQDNYHDPSGEQIESIRFHRPCPAAHTLFWQGVYASLIRGDVKAAIGLLRKADWAKVKKGTRGDVSYTGQALANINRVVAEACDVMDECPGAKDDWDIRNSDWTLFRLKAKAAKEGLISFTEGKDRADRTRHSFNDSDLSDSFDGRESHTVLARKAESRLPWDIYESLQSLYSILVGEAEAITAAAQDWCEATIGLFGWWDIGHNSNRKVALARSITSQPSAADDDWIDRLALSFQAAMESDFHFNSMDAVEMATACVFEGNVEGMIGFLRAWSLPVASTVAEVASLGRWLPPPEPANLIAMGSFDKEDLEVLGMNPSTESEDQDGVKDATLIQYAKALNNIVQFSGTVSKKGDTMADIIRAGWELAVQVVGRMDSPGRSEEMVNELLQGILDKTKPEGYATVDKIWALTNNLGMINFAEETAEKFGDILKEDTYRFGDMLWYYALAHCPNKVRDVLNGLMSISLTESIAYPPEDELDDRLKKLLKERAATLEEFAKQDLEAAELLGKMLSGYATLRRFYDIRDRPSSTSNLKRRQQAAALLCAAIASADDNIRGGLYDETRDAIISEDFILALLGEASVFVGQTPTGITLDQIDILLKAVEDVQTVGSRVYEAADAFFQIVLSSGQGKGSTPADLMKRSTSSLSGSFVMTGSSMMASQLHKTIKDSGLIKGPVKRNWDWRADVVAASSSQEVLRRIRLGLTRDLADLWLEQADNVIL